MNDEARQEWIKKAVEAAPPLTEEERAELAAIIARARQARREEEHGRSTAGPGTAG